MSIPGSLGRPHPLVTGYSVVRKQRLCSEGKAPD